MNTTTEEMVDPAETLDSVDVNAEQPVNIPLQHIAEESLSFRYINQQGGGLLEIKSSSKVITPGGTIREPCETFVIRGEAVSEFMPILKMLRTNLTNVVQKNEELGRERILQELAKKQESEPAVTLDVNETEEKPDESEVG
jgi:hypothetical protein